MSSSIHPSAIIDSGAKLGSGVAIGPYCVVGADVTLADGVKLHSHVVIDGKTTIGEDTEIFPFASIGSAPQDLKFHNEPSTLVIGKGNKIREHVTMNPGTEGGGMITGDGMSPSRCMRKMDVAMLRARSSGGTTVMRAALV